jgi:AMP nucleosidase
MTKDKKMPKKTEKNIEWQKFTDGHGNVKNLQEFWDADAAVARITEIYNKNVSLIRDTFLDISESKVLPEKLPKVESATYPYVGIKVLTSHLNIDHRVAFGAVLEASTYGTTVTRPDIFSCLLQKAN